MGAGCVEWFPFGVFRTVVCSKTVVSAFKFFFYFFFFFLRFVRHTYQKKKSKGWCFLGGVHFTTFHKM